MAPFRVAVGVCETHIVPVSTQLIGNNPRKRGTDVLAHFGFRDIHRDGAVAANFEPHVRHKTHAGTTTGDVGGYFLATATRQHDAESHNEGSAHAACQECPPADGALHLICSHCHDYAPSPLAATLIALRIRG